MTQQQRDALDAMLRSVPLDHGGDAVEQRQIFAEMMAQVPHAPDVVSTPGQLGGVDTVTFTIDGTTPRGTVLYFHGGAYVIGSADLSVGLASELGRRAGARVVSVDYALAPEAPYPAGLHDALSAYRALLDDGDDPTDVVIAGESAGGGLTFALALAIKEAGLPMPAGIYAASPWADLTLSGDSVAGNAAVDPSVIVDGLAVRAAQYAGEHDPAQPSISPVFGDLAGLPPTLIQAGGHEVLMDDSTRLAQNVATAGGSVTLDVTAGVPHVFVAFTGLLDEADRAVDLAGQFIRGRLDADED